MAKVFDFLDDATGDLLIENGDFVVGESTLQHQADLLLIAPGELKQFPTSCVGMMQYLLDDAEFSEFKKKVQTEFEADGQVINGMSGNGYRDLTINAEYGN